MIFHFSLTAYFCQAALGIAHQISEQSLQVSPENSPEACFTNFQNIFRQMSEILGTRIEIKEIGLSVGLATITTQLKDSSGNPQLRDALRARLGVTTPTIMKAINEELIKTVRQKLKQQGKNKLIVIVDNLDKLEPSPAQYLFLNQGQLLRELECDLVFSFPLALKFSDIFFKLSVQFTKDYILPMVPVWFPDGTRNEEAIKLLRQMVVKRAFPNCSNFLAEPELTRRILMIFDSVDSLDELCLKSGGNFRVLLILLQEWIMSQIENGLPLEKVKLEECIKTRKRDMKRAITNKTWALLRDVAKTKSLAGKEKYQELIHHLFVYEYQDLDNLWYVVNPILADAPEMLQKEEE